MVRGRGRRRRGAGAKSEKSYGGGILSNSARLTTASAPRRILALSELEHHHVRGRGVLHGVVGEGPVAVGHDRAQVRDWLNRKAR